MTTASYNSNIVEAPTSAGIDVAQHKFYPELESLRGVAAMFVVILHVILFTMILGTERPGPQIMASIGVIPYIIAQTGITIFNGRSSVTLFFILSGFVMSLGFDTSKRLELKEYFYFLVKRFFRLVPPLWVAIIFAMTLGYFARGQHYSSAEIINFFLMKDINIDLVSWTLVLELAVCLIYPLMLFAICRLSLGTKFIGLLVMLWFFSLTPPLNIHYGQTVGGLPIFAFYLGLIVPTLGCNIVRRVPFGGAPIIPVAIVIFMSPEALNCYADFNPGSAITPTWMAYFNIFVEFSCFYVVAWLVYGPHRSIARLLQRPTFLALGRWSYSIYIYHFPITQVVQHHFTQVAASPMVRLAVGAAVVIPSTLVIAALSYRYIEMPFMRLSRRLIPKRPLADLTLAAPIGAITAAQHSPGE